MTRLRPALLPALLAIALVSACAPPSTEGTRPFNASKKGAGEMGEDDITDAPAPTTTASATTPPVVSTPVDAGTSDASATTYVGRLDATPTVRFGGKGTTGNYCNYDVTLKDVTIEVTALPSGAIIAASVKNTMVEASVPPCTFAPAAPAVNDYVLTTSKTTADGAQLAFKGAATNHPASSLIIDIVKNGSSYDASAVWHRTDQGDPLDWTVKTKITLGPR